MESIYPKWPIIQFSRNNIGQKCEGNCGLWVLNEINKKIILRFWQKSLELFGSYMLNSTANPAQFEFIKNPQTTIALTFLTNIISGISIVSTAKQVLRAYWPDIYTLFWVLMWWLLHRHGAQNGFYESTYFLSLFC